MVAKKLISKYSCNAPVLFIVFNRPSTTLKVFEKIREAKPKKLYVAADGPRNNVFGENDVCDEVRRIATNVDWPCKVYTLFRKKNLGCGKAVSGAITWFFKKEKMGIILEDDCLPDKSFFNFCSVLLKKYQNDERIGMISGNNFQYNGGIIVDESYFFSRYPHIWGWATWRRAWRSFDLKMTSWPLIKNNPLLFNKLFISSEERKCFSNWFDEIYAAPNITWDVQWIFLLRYNGLLSISPNKNLVKNIGFSSFSTHTSETRKFILNTPLESISLIKHPLHVVVNTVADDFTFKQWFKVGYVRLFAGYLPKSMFLFLKRMFGR